MTAQPINLHERSTGYSLAPDQLLFTTEEAAEVLRVGRTTVYARIRSGEVRPVHIGRSCRISRHELDRYVARLDTGDGRSPTESPQDAA
jgi:excisionase family DNA binding protein